MKIAVISPILAPQGTDYRRQYRMRDCAGISAEFTFSYIEEGPRFILNDYDDAQAVPGLLKKVIAAEKEGADAVVINCSADTGLRACREAVGIPVIGPSRCAMLYASQLVDRYAVLTFSTRINGRFTRMAHELGVSDTLACVMSVGIDFDEIGNGDEKVRDALFDAIVQIQRERGCDGFLLGCTDFEDVASQLKEKLESNAVEAVLLKPFEIAVHQAYITVAMGLRQGRLSYPRPSHSFN